MDAFRTRGTFANGRKPRSVQVGGGVGPSTWWTLAQRFARVATWVLTPASVRTPFLAQYGLTHISAGDLLRAEVAAGTKNGKVAKEYMDRGDLVPNEVVIDMVKDRLSQDDAQTNGWLLDGYPRSADQAKALEEAGIHPDLFLNLEVPDDVLVERVVGRRMDPETGKIYHLKFNPPPEEIVGRLTQRSDDTEEKARNRLATHHKNVGAVVESYKDILVTIDGNRPREAVFEDIEKSLERVAA